MFGRAIVPGFDLEPQLVLRNRDWEELNWGRGGLFDGGPFDRSDAYSCPVLAIDGSRVLFDSGISAARGSLAEPLNGPGSAANDPVLSAYWAGSGNGTDGYDIVLEFKGSGWTSDLQHAFIGAADYFATVITADIGGNAFAGGRPVDDLYVSAELTTIDGAGGVLGQAGPTTVWTATDLSALGEMEFDLADAVSYLDQGLWPDIVAHELMHVLGFGSLWEYGRHRLVYDDPDPAHNDWYVGPIGNAVFAALLPGARSLPVEADGGPGTAGAHWDEQALTNELMTGYLNQSGNFLSPFSVASLADLGYGIRL